MEEPIYQEIDENDDEIEPVSDSHLYKEIPNEQDKLNLSLEKRNLQKSKLAGYTKYLENTEDALIALVEDDFFDLPEQEVIDEDCAELSRNLDIPDDDIGTVELELRTIITVYSKSEKKRYRRGNGWLPLLGQLMLKRESKAKTYMVFKNIRDDFIPTPETHGYVLRLLILYHDPQLCNLLDTDNISLAKCTQSWINSLFVGISSKSVIDVIWKFIFSQDAFMIFFIFLAIIIKHRSEIFGKKFAELVKREKQIESFPRNFNSKTICSIIDAASQYNKNTPSFFKRFFAHFMFGEIRNKVPKNLPAYLPTSAIEVVQNVIGHVPSLTFDYVVADCRPSEQYNAGRLSTSNHINVDCDMLEYKSYLDAAVKEIINRTKNERISEPSTAANEPLYSTVSKSQQLKHVCLMGSGPTESDNCIKIFAEELLKKGVKYISILTYGYESVHNYAVISRMMDTILIKHNRERCNVCNPNREPSPARSVSPVVLRNKAKLAEKVKKKLRKTGVIVRAGLFSCVADSSGTHCEENIYENLPSPRQSESLYPTSDIGTLRSQVDREIYGISSKTSESIMTVDDDDDNDEEQEYPVASISEFMREKTAQMFECKQILKSKNKEHNSYLILSDRDFIVLRRMKDVKDLVYLIKKCRILNVEKCTISPRNKHLATFYFDKLNERGEKVPDGKITLNVPKIREVSTLFGKIYNSQLSS